MRLVFRQLFLFSPSEKKAKAIDFIDGINIITSSQEDGTDRGKSVIMRSLFHCLGAEGCFEKNWRNRDKVYVLRFSIDDRTFYIYRSVELYKFFDEDKKLLFTSVSSRDLSEKLFQYTRFAVQLPNRNDKLEVTPPAYNYLPFFIDQDHYEGNEYASFSKLSQYANFRENVLFYQLGAYDEEYFNIIKQRDQVKDHKEENEIQLEMYRTILDSLNKKMVGTSFSSEFEAMQRDVRLFQDEYATVLNKLGASKKKLIELRNSLVETERMLREIEEVTETGEHKIKKLRSHVCPECGSQLKDTIQLKSKNYNIIEDAIAIKNELQVVLLESQQKIEKEEAIYKDLLSQMRMYEEKIHVNRVEADSVLKQKGMAELRDEIVSELERIGQIVRADDEEIGLLTKKIKEYGEKKKAIESAYYEYMITARTKFGINELSPESFKKLTYAVKASGSNKNVATIMWYIAVLELRKRFNSGAIRYPVVFDSINNVETDNEKKYGLVQYVVEKCEEEQLVLSLLGYKKGDIDTERPINIIELTNEKYMLLDKESYEINKSLLEELCDAE